MCECGHGRVQEAVASPVPVQRTGLAHKREVEVVLVVHADVRQTGALCRRACIQLCLAVGLLLVDSSQPIRHALQLHIHGGACLVPRRLFAAHLRQNVVRALARGRHISLNACHLLAVRRRRRSSLLALLALRLLVPRTVRLQPGAVAFPCCLRGTEAAAPATAAAATAAGE